jgi:hypothetical protein
VRELEKMIIVAVEPEIVRTVRDVTKITLVLRLENGLCEVSAASKERIESPMNCGYLVVGG